ncbi:6658_t:CDS:2 [Paraglomus brasilianum]|uniref:6658_t:CDS:1 n=1 Tax=Paraglomus brasilianum TaxID=144538 RepID=A0A9N9DG07_9GLOM|nr:6658_t:CDS:2 [Paraglomus brasilianum]
MSITLVCLIKGNLPENAFAIDINYNSNKLISHLKDAIKAKNVQTFANIDAKDLKLWKVVIPADRADLIQGQPQLLQDNNQLKATDYIDDYWTVTPKRRHIHVIVEAPTDLLTEQEFFRIVLPPPQLFPNATKDTTESLTRKAPKKPVQLWETFFTEAFNASLNYDANALTFKSPVAQ